MAKQRKNSGDEEAEPESSRPELGGGLRFLLTCGVYVALVIAFSAIVFSDVVFDDPLAWLRVAFTEATGYGLGIFGMDVRIHGTVISGPSASLMIVNECTGVDATILLVCAVLVFPCAWSQRLIGVLLSIGVMMLVNYVRVLTLVYIGNYSAGWLEIAHIYIWPVFVIITGVATLLVWAEKLAVVRA